MIRLLFMFSDSKQYGSLLITVIMSKVPNDIRLKMARKNRGRIWDMDKAKSPSYSHSTASSLAAGVKTIQCVYIVSW